eukprot:TRINITY_DN1028_c0_g1_i1.p1 TRINITY_DN1028_c0_g1~~TRINITY_DN1028_c0_g1_i1.p1  ORF type:complete len:469 (+),score=118.96 TRINITY_DN1028_c0_g1_i1:449-1855(+)
MSSAYSGRGRPSRAAASRRQQDSDSDEAPPPKPSGRGRGRGGGRGAGRPRGKATAAAARQAAPPARGAPVKPKNVSHSVMSALAKGINRCEQCGIEFYQQPPFSQASWMWIVYEALRRLHDEGKPHRKYFHYKLDICNFIDRNWLSLCPTKKRTPTWNNTVSAVITTHPKLFKSNRKQSGYWTLKKLTPGGNDGSSDEDDIGVAPPAVVDDYDSGLGEHQGGVDIGRPPKTKRQQQILMQQQHQQQQQQQQHVQHQPPMHVAPQHHHAAPAPITIAPLATPVSMPIAAPTASILSSKKRTHGDMLAGNPAVGVGGITGVSALVKRRKPNPPATALVQTSLASTVANTLSNSASNGVAASSAHASHLGAASSSSSSTAAAPNTPAIADTAKTEVEKHDVASSSSAASVPVSSTAAPASEPAMDFMDADWNRGPFKPASYEQNWSEVNDMDLDNPQMLEEPHGSAGPSSW